MTGAACGNLFNIDREESALHIIFYFIFVLWDVHNVSCSF